jgi:hypothetical protein
MRDGAWCEALGCVTPPSLCPLSNTWPQFCVDAVGPQKNIVASLSHLQCKLVLRLASCTRTPRGQTSQSDSKKRSEPKSTPSKSPRAIPYWRRPSWAALGDLPIELMARNRTYFR